MNMIYQGKLTTTNTPFVVRKLTIDHLDELLALQQLVHSEIKDASLLQPLTSSEYEYILKGNGLMIGAYADEQLIGYRALLEPPIDEHHLGHYVGLAENKLKEVIYQEISIVHPAYRRNRLQQQLAWVIMDELDKEGHRFNYLCCTVSPSNIPSVKDK